MNDIKIIKSSGHCYDDWKGRYECYFWGHNVVDSVCTLFGGNEGVSKEGSIALKICDKIYGLDYEGEV